MAIKIIKKKIKRDELKEIAEETFGEMVKAVVDIKQKVIALGGELHADAEAILLKQNSKQENLWGINIYPDKSKDNWIEFSALINIRPLLNNRSMKIQNSKVRDKIKKILNDLIE